MSRKKFKNSFDDLFNDAVDGKIEESDTKKKAVKKKTPASKKSFISDLNSLFEETITEATIENAKTIQKGKSPKETRRKSTKRKPSFGIDSLIRETVENSTLERKPVDNGLKRITITVKETNLDKLKKIARLQKSYLKDIINEVVADYITEYETHKKG